MNHRHLFLLALALPFFAASNNLEAMQRGFISVEHLEAAFSKENKNLMPWAYDYAVNMYNEIFEFTNVSEMKKIITGMRELGGNPKKYFDSVRIKGQPLMQCVVNIQTEKAREEIYKYLTEELTLDTSIVISTREGTKKTIAELYREKHVQAMRNLSPRPEFQYDVPIIGREISRRGAGGEGFIEEIEEEDGDAEYLPGPDNDNSDYDRFFDDGDFI